MSNHDTGITRSFDLALMWKVVEPFRTQAVWVLFLVMVDTTLASLGVGIVLPVFKALLDPAHKSEILEIILPFISGLPPGKRLTVVAGITVALFALKALIDIYTKIASNEFIQKMRYFWVQRIGENFLFGPQKNIAGKKQGELLNNWFNETMAATRFFQAYLLYLTSVVLVLGLVVLGLIINLKVMISMLAVGTVISLVAGRVLFGRAASLSKIKVNLNQNIQTSMVENLAHIRELKLMAAEQMRLDHIGRINDKLKSVIVKGSVFGEIPRVLGEFFAVFAMMAFVVVGVVMFSLPVNDILPVIAFFFIAFYRLVSAGSLAMSSRVKALNELHSVVVVQQLVTDSSCRENMDSGRPLVTIDTDIVFDSIRYSYDGSNDVITNLNTSIPKGRVTFIIGPSGSGKSTLLDLLMRFDEPAGGTIQVNDGASVDYSLSTWRKLFGYVSQETALFNGDIRMNLLLANPGAGDDEIERVCRLAGADEFIKTLPSGLNTLVGERGFSLSGGQRKRIAIARALIQNPSVLILDEATTSFEQSLEQEMLRGLKTALPDLTIIQVTHRLQTAGNADWVIAMDNGVIQACGPWDSVRNDVLGLFGKTGPREKYETLHN